MIVFWWGYNGNRRLMSQLKKEGETISVEQIAQRYHSVIGNNFQKRENELILELFEGAQQLKQELLLFRRESSQENIDKLVAERRRSKERERQVLESRWRECNQAFKHMQDEQKRLKDDQKEYCFDIGNLEQKIAEFRTQTDKIRQRMAAKAAEGRNEFVTEPKEGYQSPYKAHSAVQQKILDRLEYEQRLLTKTQPHFFGSKYQPNRTGAPKGRDISSMESECRVLRVVAQHRNALKQGTAREGESAMRLYHFLDSREVRLKLFKLLKQHH